MVSNYQRKAGSRNYKTGYSPAALENALREINAGNLSIRKASKQYKIPYGTLCHKSKGIHTKKQGGQYRLSKECEDLIVRSIVALTEWKVPLTGRDIRCLVKSYLDSRGVTDATFDENCPGKDWLERFTKRHNLTQRIATNIKSSRAEITQERVIQYFDNLEPNLSGIPPENLFNYDETNITDDPGAVKVVVQRGLRRIERKKEHSKQSISVMFCGNSAGEYLPPMVVYTAQNLYSTWTEGGPPGAAYDATPSGWFDSRTFESWFALIFLSNVVSKPGPKALIGDNLPSHFSPKVIEGNNIKFITMPPASTHLCQPLDVAVFRPAKRIWRKQLDNWRKETRRKGSIPKNQFPRMLKTLCESLRGENLVSGFRATGLYPLDRRQILKRLPGSNQDPGGEETADVLNESVTEWLRNHCGVGVTNQRRQNRRGRRIVPGRPITSSDVSAPQASDQDSPPANVAQTNDEAQTNDQTDLQNDTTWVCNECHEPWDEDGDDRWILCDSCDKQFHLQCSGVNYRRKDYYDIDIERMPFTCEECN